MKHIAKLYAEICKSEQQEDGTLKVWGYASTEAVDSDGETITSDAMKAALPDYMKFGAVREMHQPKAAGTAIEASVEADGRTFFGAHIVDSEAVKKVQAGVYKGFSIGGKVTERDTLNKTIIKGIKLIEVSLVDRPANPEAVFTMFKAEVERTAEDDVSELAELLNKGEISPADVLALIKASKEPADHAPETVEKGMGHVAQMALLLKAILSLVQDQVAEATREGDGSTMPAKLQDWLDAGGELLKEMAAEETAELVGESAEAQTNYSAPGAIYLAERALALVKSDDVAKVGAALSAANKTLIQSIHDASAALGACMAFNSPDGAGKHAHAEDLAKAAALTEELTKAQAELAATSESLAKAELRATTAEAETARLKAAPALGKALLKAVTVSKENDTADITKTTADAPAVPQSTDPLELIKAAQLTPRIIPMR